MNECWNYWKHRSLFRFLIFNVFFLNFLFLHNGTILFRKGYVLLGLLRDLFFIFFILFNARFISQVLFYFPQLWCHFWNNMLFFLLIVDNSLLFVFAQYATGCTYLKLKFLGCPDHRHVLLKDHVNQFSSSLNKMSITFTEIFIFFFDD